MATSPTLVLGLDIGGTSTRALVIDTQGNRRGGGRGPGANLTSHAVNHALDAISGAVRRALAHDDIDPAGVRAAVVGTAGDNNLRQPAAAEAFHQMWRSAGLACDYRVVSDAQVAFVAGTPEPDGSLVLCGTGALMARFGERRRVHTVDGHGWLLGDIGSGFWLGREAVRATLAAIDRLGQPGSLGRAVLRTLLPGDSALPGDTAAADLWSDPATTPGSAQLRDLASRLVLAVHSRPPVMLAELAPLVTAEVHADPEARRIIDDAAEHLLRGISLVRTEGETSPIVFAGSLLTERTPLREVLEPRLAELWPKARISAATDGAAGAAWLAATDLLGPDSPESAELHARLFDR